MINKEKVNRITIFLSSVIILSMPLACKNNNRSQEMSEKLKSLLDGVISDDAELQIHNAALLIANPGKNFMWKGAVGMADGVSEAMTADHKYRIASISKTFTATIVMQLVEEDKLSIEDTIDNFFTGSVIDLDQLHIHNGVSYGRQITIKQLLNHTSGLKDYIFDDERFLAYVFENLTVQWTPSSIMQKYFEYNLNLQSEFPPGTNYKYSDTNYLLLAMIIEKVTSSKLQAEYKTRIFDKLGMDNSYLEFYDEPRGDKPMSHPFYGANDILEVNTSFDWGGGGIISTNEELATFALALFQGKLFKNDATLEQMLMVAGDKESDTLYGLGVYKLRIGEDLFLGHVGAYGSGMFYCPEKDIIICATVNQAEAVNSARELVFKSAEIIEGLN